MKETFDKIIAWVKANPLIAVLVGVAGLLMFGGGKIKRLLFGTRRRKRRRRVTRTRTTTRRRTVRRTARRRLPRSVGTRKTTGKGYPAAGGGYIPFKYNKDGTVKKAWQVGGTVAAKNRMARLRRNR